jgi:hypothetical protein
VDSVTKRWRDVDDCIGLAGPRFFQIGTTTLDYTQKFSMLRARIVSTQETLER